MAASKQQKGLGKGLSALMGEGNAPTAPKPAPKAVEAKETPVAEKNIAPNEEKSTTSSNVGNTSTLPLKALQSGKYQPRLNFRVEKLQELADSIAQNGIMQPIVVRPLEGEKGKYEIVAGERRWRAAKLADLSEVPVIIREMSDKVALELALVENIQRADLGPIEEAIGYQRLIDEFDYKQEELAERIGKSRSHIANILRLLGLPDEVKEMLDNGDLTMGHARPLLGTKNPLELAQEVVRKGLSVRQTEALTRRDPNKPVGRPRKSSQQNNGGGEAVHSGDKDPDIIALEATLSENLGLQVSIDDHGSHGKITVNYTTLSQLDDILQRLGGSI